MLANELLEHGTIFVVEDMDYKALQKRAKETKINEKTGRAHSKKRYGKSISRCAPAMFISVLSQKAARYNGRVVKVSTFKTKASQFADTKASALGDYLPAVLGFDDGEKPLYMVNTVDYSGYMIFIFENGKAAKVPLNAYETKTNRKKLGNAYSLK